MQPTYGWLAVTVIGGAAALLLVGRRQRRMLLSLLRASPAASLAPGMLTIGPRVLADAAVKGHLFDVDGTLIDTMPLFFHSWVDVCESFGLSITEHQFCEPRHDDRARPPPTLPFSRTRAALP